MRGAGLMLWAERVGLGSKLALLLTALAVVSGLATVAIFFWSGGVTSQPGWVLSLIGLDLGLIFPLSWIVVWRAAKLWGERRVVAAGTLLHVRGMATLFAVLTALPAISLAVLFAIFFGLEVQAWFGERVQTTVTQSVKVADDYLREHQQAVVYHVLGLANDLEREWPEGRADPRGFQRLVETYARMRALDEVVVFEDTGHFLATVGLETTPDRGPPSPDARHRAADGELVILPDHKDDRVRALVGLLVLPPAFLLVGRNIDPNVLAHVDSVNGAAAIYDKLRLGHTENETAFAGVFVLAALLMLLAAVVVGLNFANRLARPIGRLVAAAERVRGGDLSAQVEEGGQQDELGTLLRSFNRMTSQLRENRHELVEANRELDERRRFTETVLAGVTAGVVGLDSEGRINLPNPSAIELLSTDYDSLIGKPLGTAVPEMAALFASARRKPGSLAEGQLTLVRNDQAATLHVRIAGEVEPSGEVLGYVVTFDDVTALLAAQRKAAWADVARRIAHEIKNPLTPIQLSAERLKRKYLGEITSDRETFEQCTDTIVRQVGDIGRMIDEFAAFARMPAPVKRSVDLARICREAVFLQRNARPETSIAIELPESLPPLVCDAGMLAQALTNILKNAGEAIDARPAEAKEPGRMSLRAEVQENSVRIIVEDNGEGLPVDRQRLTEPYVTTRAKGTGLGLAIVKKIMEDHVGDLIMENRDGGGARVILTFPGDATEDLQSARRTAAEIRMKETGATHGA